MQLELLPIEIKTFPSIMRFAERIKLCVKIVNVTKLLFASKLFGAAV